MSREERKMAQIIASIERMEQRKAPTPSSAPASSRTDATDHPGLERLNSSEIHAQVQKSSGRLGAKGRKLKPLGSAQSGGSKAKVKAASKRTKTPQVVAVDSKVVASTKLTPKKRWIQLWTEQLSSPSDESPDADANATNSTNSKDDIEMDGSKSDAREAAGSTAEHEPEHEPSQGAPASDAPVVQSAEPAPPSAEPTPATVDAIRAQAPVAAPAIPSEQAVRVRPTIVSKDAADEESEEEEGEERQSAAPDASLASPSPQTDEQKDTSISPVSSVKESLKDAPAALTPPKTNEERTGNFMSPTDASAAAPAGDTPATLPTTTTTAASAKIVRSAASVTKVVLEDGGADDASKARQPLATELIARASPSMTTAGAGHERSRKRSLERKNSEPLTEEEKRRAERRRQRKSNWDVGDPRFAARNGDKPSGRSPLTDDSALASKFPPGRPSWRHSNSMDATHSSGKPGFPNRSSFGGGSGNGPPRRGFYSSNSLPLDRSRSAGRSMSGYHYPNSYR